MAQRLAREAHNLEVVGSKPTIAKLIFFSSFSSRCTVTALSKSRGKDKKKEGKEGEKIKRGEQEVTSFGSDLSLLLLFILLLLSLRHLRIRNHVEHHFVV